MSASALQRGDEFGAQQHPHNQVWLDPADQYLVEIVPLRSAQVRLGVKHLQIAQRLRDVCVALPVDCLTSDRIKVVLAIEFHAQFTRQPALRHTASNPNHAFLHTSGVVHDRRSM